MTPDATPSAVLLLGLVLGLQHALDPDHLAAVATIVTRERRFWAGATVGALWGLGHMLTLIVAGGVVIGLNLTVRPDVATGFELLVAAMLVAIGLLRLREATRGLAAVPRPHLLDAHDHGGRDVVHSHPHAHARRVHRHPHLHPSPSLLARLSGAGGRGGIVLVGVVHGLAGTAALSLLVLSTVESLLGAVVYLVVFGLGTVAGMTLLTAALAFPVTFAMRVPRLQRLVGAGAGLGSIAFGLFYALSAL